MIEWRSLIFLELQPPIICAASLAEVYDIVGRVEGVNALFSLEIIWLLSDVKLCEWKLLQFTTIHLFNIVVSQLILYLLGKYFILFGNHLLELEEPHLCAICLFNASVAFEQLRYNGLMHARVLIMSRRIQAFPTWETKWSFARVDGFDLLHWRFKIEWLLCCCSSYVYWLQFPVNRSSCCQFIVFVRIKWFQRFLIKYSESLHTLVSSLNPLKGSPINDIVHLGVLEVIKPICWRDTSIGLQLS